ncbi:MAG: radical SAM superfamily enzyme [Oleispira sp.]|jgi:radical SAM superfamily enzyme
MNRTITFVFFVVISSFCLSSSINMSVGDSEDKLYEIEGDATQVTELTIKNKTFVTYFYQATNTSFIVEKELKTICKISQGKVNGTCP